MEKQIVFSGIEFGTENLSNYSHITAPGTYTLEVASTVTEKNLVQNSNGGASYIVGFKAIADDKMAQVLEVFNGKHKVAIEETQGLFLTGNLWKNAGGVSRLPIKNEKMDVVIDWVPTRENKDEVVLRIKSMNLRPVTEAKKLDISSFFSGTPATSGTLVKQEA
jgi:hypothetical protein